MSFTSAISPIGCLVVRESLGTLCNGVLTTPGATALKRIPSFAYSIARLRVTVFKPPFVIIETEAFTPAMGLIRKSRGDTHNVPRFLFQHLFHGELGNVKESQEISRDQGI